MRWLIYWNTRLWAAFSTMACFIFLLKLIWSVIGKFERWLFFFFILFASFWTSDVWWWFCFWGFFFRLWTRGWRRFPTLRRHPAQMTARPPVTLMWGCLWLCPTGRGSWKRRKWPFGTLQVRVPSTSQDDGFRKGQRLHQHLRRNAVGGRSHGPDLSGDRSQSVLQDALLSTVCADAGNVRQPPVSELGAPSAERQLRPVLHQRRSPPPQHHRTGRWWTQHSVDLRFLID